VQARGLDIADIRRDDFPARSRLIVSDHGGDALLTPILVLRDGRDLSENKAFNALWRSYSCRPTPPVRFSRRTLIVFTFRRRATYAEGHQHAATTR
jgi:hypothetical protein